MGVEQDGKVEVHGDVTVDRTRIRMLDGGWNFRWDDCGVSVEDEKVDEVMSLVGFLVSILTKFLKLKTTEMENLTSNSFS